MHPTLFPILLVLTRLEPSPNGRGTSKPTLHDLNAFIPYLKESAKHPQHKARVMSARALSAILSPEYVMETLLSIINETKEPAAYQSHNKLHGSLLIILSICENLLYNSVVYNINNNDNDSNSNSSSSNNNNNTYNNNNGNFLAHGIQTTRNELDQYIYQFCKFMIQNILQLSQKNAIFNCFPVFSILMDIIKLFSSNNNKRDTTIFIDLGIEFSTAIMNHIAKTKVLLQVDIGGTHLLESCSEYLAFHDTIATIINVGLLNHSRQEVTIIALKQIKHRVKHNIHINLDDDCKAISIHILNNMLRNETEIDKESFILRHELRLLDLCNLKLHLKRNDATFRSKLFQYLNKIIEQHISTNNPRVVGEAIELLGQVVESITLLDNNNMEVERSGNITSSNAMSQLINILDQCSTEEQDMYMRYGCIGALSHLISFFQLKHWKICLRLLQDDDKDVRNKARHVIGKMLNCVNYCDGALLRQAYAYLGKMSIDNNNNNNSNDENNKLIEYLIQKIENVASKLIINMNSLASKTRMVTSLKSLFDRPIFEMEEMNMHIEILGEVQLASELLLNIVRNNTDSNKLIRNSGNIFLTRINTLIKQVKQNHLNNNNNHWLGGITYDSGVFSAFVANVMGARACNIDLNDVLNDDSIGDGEVLLLHPMILRVGKTTMLKKNGNEKKQEDLQRKKTLFAV